MFVYSYVTSFAFITNALYEPNIDMMKYSRCNEKAGRDALPRDPALHA
jgi:hypothetical protein